MYHMRQVSVRDLRYDFPKVERALRAGEEIEITKHRQVIARLVPERARGPLPDFAGRLRAIFGDTKLAVTGAELISEERNGR